MRFQPLPVRTFLTAFFLSGCLLIRPQPGLSADLPRIILDVDLAEDVDDAGAVALLHALADRGECVPLATMVSSRNEWVVPCLDAINTWYGRGDLPIGYQRGLQYGYLNTKDADRQTSSSYAEAVAKALPHDLKRSSDAPDATDLYRRILAAQPDGSVTIVTVGFLTNLKNLLDSRPDASSKLDGEALVKAKVKQWVCMGGIFPGGRFPDGNGEYNLMWDTVASVRAVNDWPTPVVFSGFSIGAGIKVGARLRESPEANPVRACYQHYNGLKDREAWDQTAVLYAVRGARDYWTLSEPGFCLMHHRVGHGYNEWLSVSGKQHRYLVEKMPPAEVGRVIEDLMLQTPRGRDADARLPASGDAAWISLFDGRSLRGWKTGESPGTFKIVDGAIVARGPRSHLFYAGDDNAKTDFRDFELELEVMTRPGANSGVYFHTAFQDEGWPRRGFEVQINNSQPAHGEYLELKKTGSLYGIRNIYKAVASDNTWFQMRIRVQGRRVQIRVNDLLLVDYVEPAGGGSRRRRQLAEGTFALQGHDPGSETHFRNIRVRRLPAAPPDTGPSPELDDVARQLLRLSGNNFPVIDFHVHLKGGLTLEQTLEHMRRTGINCGIAVNGGIGFPITDDEGLERFRRSMEGAPCFIGLQAEGREWPTLFSAQATARFDYVFTDAMTITDHRGKRARLWIPEEVDIPDKQAFMEHLVSSIVKILENEPIDIYANPTYLPDVIASEYDALWTPERMDRVIAAAAKRGVAIEINSRFKIPGKEFIRRAKEAGVKFTMGTNNGDRQLGRLEYSLQMVRECGLEWKDMWMPRTDGRKPVQVRQEK